MPKKILLALVDYDGCAGYPIAEKIRDRNMGLYDYLFEQIKEYQKAGFVCEVIFCIGSARQSYSVDRHNADKTDYFFDDMREDAPTGSCLNMLPALISGLTELLDKKNVVDVSISPSYFLLPDLYHDLPEGTTYERMMQEWSKPLMRVQPEFLFDDDKVTLVYAFMQTHSKKIMADCNDTSIHCYFFDDRTDILTTCGDFFSLFPDYLPKKCKLTLVNYARDFNNTCVGKISSNFNIRSIEGNGKIQHNVRNSLFNLIKNAFSVDVAALLAREVDLANCDLPRWKKENFDALRRCESLLSPVTFFHQNTPAATRSLCENPVVEEIVRYIAGGNFIVAYQKYFNGFAELTKDEINGITKALIDNRAGDVILKAFSSLQVRQSAAIQQATASRAL